MVNQKGVTGVLIHAEYKSQFWAISAPSWGFDILCSNS